MWIKGLHRTASRRFSTTQDLIHCLQVLCKDSPSEAVECADIKMQQNEPQRGHS